MNLDIVTRNGETINLKPLTRKQKIKIGEYIKNNKNDINEMNFEVLDEMFYIILQFNKPEITKEQTEDILDFYSEEYGFEETYEMLSYLIEDLFTIATGEKKELPYLVEKRKEKTI